MPPKQSRTVQNRRRQENLIRAWAARAVNRNRRENEIEELTNEEDDVVNEQNVNDEQNVKDEQNVNNEERVIDVKLIEKRPAYIICKDK